MFVLWVVIAMLGGFAIGGLLGPIVGLWILPICFCWGFGCGSMALILSQ